MNKKIGEIVILKKGWGYWDMSHYPIGGDFKRTTEEISVVIKKLISYKGNDYIGIFNGEEIAFSSDCIKE
jgi:hypothetical protein